jgi:hypothetical protein
MTTAEPTRPFTIVLVTSATGRWAKVVRTLVVMLSPSASAGITSKSSGGPSGPTAAGLYATVASRQD